jgi:steroid delta-isomerase-like uncharacterized protein
MKKIYGLLALVAVLAMGLPFTSCKNATQEAAELSIKNKAICRKTITAMNNGDLTLLDTAFAADYVEHSPDPMATSKGLPALKEMYTMMRTAFPDIKIEVINAVAEGDHVIIHQTLTGTNTGSMGGMPATGKAVKADGVDMFIVKDGKIVEHWAVYDSMTMMTQMGMAMAPEAAAAPADSTVHPEIEVEEDH